LLGAGIVGKRVKKKDRKREIEGEIERLKHK
jgi:hypothetical protein